MPLDDDEIAARIARTVEAAAASGGRGEWYIRLMLTRGVGELTYDPAACSTPTAVVIVKELVEPPAGLYLHGARAIVSSIVRNHPGTVSPVIKSNNLLNCALAMQEAVAAGAFEAIMRNYKGELAEGALSNLFIVTNGVVRTPPLSAGILPGITREFVIEITHERGVPVKEMVLLDADLFAADEAFVTSTTREIVPIVRVDEQTIGRGEPGPLTRELHAAFRAKTGN